MSPPPNIAVHLVQNNTAAGLRGADKNGKKQAQDGVIEELDRIFDELAEQDPLWLEHFKSKKKI